MVLGAILAPLMIGVAALVLEFGGGLLAKVRLQRVADMAAFAGATAYSRDAASNISLAAQMVGRLNGVAASAVTAELVASPTGDGSQVVKVRVLTTNRLTLAKVIGYSGDLPVAATAFASIGGGVEACVLALNGSGQGVKLSGGTSLTAAKCAVASNASVAVPCGTTITAKEVAYNGTAPSAPCGGVKNASGATLTPKQKSTADPLANHSGVTAATGRISTVAALTSPAAPAVAAGPGGSAAKDIDFGYDQAKTQAAAVKIGCTAAFASPTWTLTCPNGGSYGFGKVTIGGGISLKFSLSGTSGTTYNFADVLALTGATLEFGPGVYNFAKGLTTGGGTTTTFGAGTFSFGRLAAACADGAFYSLCHTGTALTFGGPSVFSFNSGFNVAGGSTLTLGAGTSNGFNVGAASNGSAVVAGGGSKTIFADASSGNGFFRLAGALNVLGGGGSCMTLPAAAQHDINGFMASAGGTTLGAGVYTVNGYIAFGSAGGGDVTCNGQTVGVKGVDVTLVTSGASSVPSGSCQGVTFCLGSGYGNVLLTAPTSGATAKLAIVGPTSGVAGGASLTEGSATSVSGAFYFPKGPVTLGGGASIGSGAGQCLQIIGTEVVLSGGTTAASTCIGGSASSGSVALIQ